MRRCDAEMYGVTSHPLGLYSEWGRMAVFNGGMRALI